MKKKVFAMLMAVVMAFSLMACGNKTDNGSGGMARLLRTLKSWLSRRSTLPAASTASSWS